LVLKTPSIADKDVVLKLMHNEEEYLREIEMRQLPGGGTLDGAHVLQLLDHRELDRPAGEDDERLRGEVDYCYMLVMDKGMTDLSDALSHTRIAGRKLPEVVKIARQVAGHLCYLNEKCNRLHGDVKPRNSAPRASSRGAIRSFLRQPYYFIKPCACRDSHPDPDGDRRPHGAALAAHRPRRVLRDGHARRPQADQQRLLPARDGAQLPQAGISTRWQAHSTCFWSQARRELAAGGTFDDAHTARLEVKVNQLKFELASAQATNEFKKMPTMVEELTRLQAQLDHDEIDEVILRYYHLLIRLVRAKFCLKIVVVWFDASDVL
jgi:hypothetical protein